MKKKNEKIINNFNNKCIKPIRYKKNNRKWSINKFRLNKEKNY